MKDDCVYSLVLGSKSPRRKELLGWLKIPFIIEVADCQETSNFVDPQDVAMDIARQKGLAVYQVICNKSILKIKNPLIVASDTIVVVDNEILGKPQNKKNAVAMLLKLAGRTHTVITGVHIGTKDIESGEYREKVFFTQTKVTFNNISQDLLNNYIDSGESMDKAGAYGIQGQSLTFISNVEGSYSNVVGFPLAEFIDELKDFLGHKGDTTGEWRKMMRMV